jgi:hypothetical protein
LAVIHFSRFAFFLVAALPALADDLLPAVATGSSLQGESIIRAAGSVPLANTRVTVSAPSGCATFGGAASVEVTSDSAGLYTFILTAGSTPGPCRIEGRAGGNASFSETLIYRPADVVLVADRVLQTFDINTSTTFTLTASANAVPLYGVAVGLEMLFTGGAGATLYAPSPYTSTTGIYPLQVNANGIGGIYDIVVRVGGATRVLRAVNIAAAATDPPGRSVRVQFVPAGFGEVRLSIVEAPFFCNVRRAVYVRDFSAQSPAPGMAGFPFGQVLMEIDCPENTARLRLDYPKALPADGVFLLNGATAGSSSVWSTVPSTVSGNSVTFTLVDEGLGDRANSPGGMTAVAGVAKPGVRPTPPPIPPVKDMWWAGPQENGWGMSIAQSGQGLLFAAIYAYDENGRPTWWTVPGGFWDDDRAGFESDLFAPYGTPWYAYDPKLTYNGASVGPVRLAFTDSDHATLDYSIKGVAGQKTLRRQAFGPPGAAPLSGVGGMWWGGPAQSGWGVSIFQQNATLFAVWYTYDELNRPTWFVMPGGGWTSGDTYEGRMYRTRGSPLQAYDASRLQVFDVGPYKIKFSGTNATLDYSVDGMTGTLQLTRQAPF